MQTAPFVELLAVPQAQAKNPLFDIIVEGKVNIQNYCNALIAKILVLRPSELPEFINYGDLLIRCLSLSNYLILSTILKIKYREEF